jgi:hypothetical protein
MAQVFARACDRALAYPFEQPRGPFVFTQHRPVFDDEPDFADLLARAMQTPRVAVIACGSNASPARLREKLPLESLAPTLAIIIRDHVVAHSAKFCSYAAMPATLHPWKGAVARLYVSLLDETELAAMDATEALGDEYARVEFEAAAVSGLPDGVTSVQTYVSLAGSLAAAPGRPAISAAARQDAPGLAPLTQREAIAHAMSVLGAREPVEDFLDRIAADAPARRAANARLKSGWALPFA